MSERRSYFVMNKFTEDNNVDVCGEIQYEKPEGWVHSDICMIHDGEYNPSDGYKNFLHDCLDEWLNNSNGTGMFWIGDPKFAVENFKEEV